MEKMYRDHLGKISARNANEASTVEMGKGDLPI